MCCGQRVPITRDPRAGVQCCDTPGVIPSPPGRNLVVDRHEGDDEIPRSPKRHVVRFARAMPLAGDCCCAHREGVSSMVSHESVTNAPELDPPILNVAGERVALGPLRRISCRLTNAGPTISVRRNAWLSCHNL